MATWDQIKQALAASGLNFQDNGDHIMSGFVFEDGRSQALRLAHRSLAIGIETITVASPIGRYDANKVKSLLIEASELPFGIAVEAFDGDEFFVVLAGVPIADLDLPELTFYLEAVPLVADGLEQEYFGADNF